MNRHGEIVIADETGRERERYGLTYGARLHFGEGDRVKAGQLLSEWDPFSVPILTEVSGVVKFGDVIEGVTMTEQLDEVTGLSRKSITECKDAELRPRISLKDEHGKTLKIPSGENDARYFLPVGSTIAANEGDKIEAGDIIARIPRETTKTKDITGGLPRVAELFESRKPKEHAVIAEIDGTVSFGKDTKGKRKVLITPERGDAKEYLISKGKHLAVREGDKIRAGEPLMDGAANPHDILKVLGEKALAKYLVDEVQEVYRLQGVKINDKHIETIVRQMLRRIRVIDVGDTGFLVDEHVEKYLFEEENERVLNKTGKPAQGEPLLLGITKASLSTESFISASSFQETTKVLTEAAVQGKVDYLRGLKENVIMGRLIPAGTGLGAYKRLSLHVEDSGADDMPVAAMSARPRPRAPAAAARSARGVGQPTAWRRRPDESQSRRLLCSASRDCRFAVRGAARRSLTHVRSMFGNHRRGRRGVVRPAAGARFRSGSSAGRADVGVASTQPAYRPTCGLCWRCRCRRWAGSAPGSCGMYSVRPPRPLPCFGAGGPTGSRSGTTWRPASSVGAFDGCRRWRRCPRACLALDGEICDEMGGGGGSDSTSEMSGLRAVDRWRSCWRRLR